MRIFLSYSRRDTDVADRMVADLESHGIEVDIDRRDLPYGEEWQTELAGFIHRADTIVWLASDASVQSQWCKWELGEAQRLSKRLLPVRISPLALGDLPEALGRIHILPAEGVYDPAQHLRLLIDAIETDRAWMETHTRLGDRAAEWIARGRSGDRLLRGKALRDAEEWRDSRPERAPAPGTDTLDLLLQSRRAATRGLRTLVALAVVGFAAMTALAGYAVWQTGIAEEQTQIALDQRDIAQRREAEAKEQRAAALANQARALSTLAGVRNRDDRPLDALSLALSAWPRSRDDALPQFDSVLSNLEGALRQRVPLVDFQTDNELGLTQQGVNSATFLSNETKLLVKFQNGDFRLYDVDTGKEFGPALVNGDFVLDFKISEDETEMIAWTAHSLRHWNLSTLTEIGAPIVLPDLGGYMEADLSGDKSLILTIYEGEASLWDAQTHQPIAEAFHQEPYLAGGRFTADDRLTLWTHGGEFTFYELEPQPRKLEVTPQRFESLAVVSGDDRLLMARLGENLHLYSMETGADQVPPMESLASDRWGFGPGGTMVWQADESVLRMWSTATGQQIGADLRNDYAWYPVFSATDRYVALSADKRVNVVDISTGQPVGPAISVGNAFKGFVSSDGTRLLIFAAEGRVAVFDTATGAQVVSGMRHGDLVRGANASADLSRIATWAQDNTFRLWDFSVGIEMAQPMVTEANLYDAYMSSDETRLLTLSSAGFAELWDKSSGQRLARASHEEWLEGVAFSADQKEFLSWAGDSIRRWSSSGNLLATMRHDGKVAGLYVGDEGRLVSWGFDNALRQWDYETGQPIAPPISFDEPVEQVVVGGEHALAITETGDLFFADLAQSEAPRPLGELAVGFTLSPDASQFLVWFDYGKVQLFDVVTGRQLAKTMMHDPEAGINGAAFDAMGQKVASWGYDLVVKVWDAATGEELFAAAQPEGVDEVQFSPDGSELLVFSRYAGISFWDWRKGTKRGPTVLHRAGATEAVYDHSGTRVAVGSGGGSIRIIDVASGLQMAPTLPLDDQIFGLSYTRDNRQLMAWSASSLHVFEVDYPDGHLVKVACNTLRDPSVDAIEDSFGFTDIEPICEAPQQDLPINWDHIHVLPASN